MPLSKRNKKDRSSAFDELMQKIEELSTRVEHLQAFTAEGQLLNSRQFRDIEDRTASLLTAVRLGVNDTALYRMELARSRQSPRYLDAYSQSEPLLTVIIPTHTAPHTLWARSLPSILQQSYSHLEVLVAVDGNYPKTFEVAQKNVEKIRDDRLKVVLAPPTPIQYPEFEGTAEETIRQFRWFSSGNGPYNYAASIASGLWLAPFSHDDEMVLNGYERALIACKRERWEFCYAPIERMSPDGETTLIHSYPPQSHNFGVQGSILNAALRFFCYDYRDAAIGIPNDWGLARTIMHAGVRIGTLDEPSSRYYPSELWR